MASWGSVKMAKFSRDQLKSLIKECLLEILTEGTVQPVAKQRIQGKTAPTQGKIAQTSRPTNESFDKAVDSAVGIMTDDPILREIIGDTARTTLQKQLSGDDQTKGGAVLSSGKESVPVDVFAGSNKWAALAFNTKDQSKK